MSLKIRSQELAKGIFDQISGMISEDQEVKDKYANQCCMKLGPLVLTNGLMQTVAFWKSKIEAGDTESEESKAKRLFLNHLGVTLGAGDLFDTLRQADATTYMRLTRQTLEAAIWYRRLAQSVLEAQPGADDRS